MAKNIQSYKTKLSFDVAAALANALQNGENLKAARARNALRSGLLAHFAKENAAHGEFQKWLAKSESLSLFSFRSIQHKMRLATAFRQDVAVTAAELERSGFIQKADDSREADKVAELAKTWIAGRSLHQLYKDYSVIKTDANGGQHNAQRHTPDELAQMEFQDLCKGWTQLAGTLHTHVTSGVIDKLPADLRWQLVEAALPALERIAANTADLTPKQLDALKERLISINGIIRERLTLKSA